MIRFRRRGAHGPAQLASMAPGAPRLGERPTVAGAVRRRLLTVGRAAGYRSADAATLPCGHPADQRHDRFHAFQPMGTRRLARGV